MQKTALVTGGTRGIGKAIVHTLLQQNFRVITCGASAATAEALMAGFRAEADRGDLQCFVVDVSQKAAIRQWGDTLALRSLDLLVHNAGRFLPGSIASEDDGTFELMIQTNLASAYHTTRTFLPALKATKGHIFTICSTSSLTAYPNGGSYGISKFGLLGMSKTLREELKPFGVKVTSILPGATITDSWAGAGLPPTRFMQPEDVAAVLWNAYTLSESCVMEEVLLRPTLGDI